MGNYTDEYKMFDRHITEAGGSASLAAAKILAVMGRLSPSRGTLGPLQQAMSDRLFKEAAQHTALIERLGDLRSDIERFAQQKEKEQEKHHIKAKNGYRVIEEKIQYILDQVLQTREV